MYTSQPSLLERALPISRTQGGQTSRTTDSQTSTLSDQTTATEQASSQASTSAMSTSSTTSSSTTAPLAAQSQTSTSSTSTPTSPTALSIVIIFSSILAVSLIAFAIFFFIRRRRQKRLGLLPFGQAKSKSAHLGSSHGVYRKLQKRAPNSEMSLSVPSKGLFGVVSRNRDRDGGNGHGRARSTDSSLSITEHITRPDLATSAERQIEFEMGIPSPRTDSVEDPRILPAGVAANNVSDIQAHDLAENPDQETSQAPAHLTDGRLSYDGTISSQYTYVSAPSRFEGDHFSPSGILPNDSNASTYGHTEHDAASIRVPYAHTDAEYTDLIEPERFALLGSGLVPPPKISMEDAGERSGLPGILMAGTRGGAVGSGLGLEIGALGSRRESIDGRFELASVRSPTRCDLPSMSHVETSAS